jgi:hypothetical protein
VRRSEGRNLSLRAEPRENPRNARRLSLIGLLLQTEHRGLLYTDMGVHDKYERSSDTEGSEQIRKTLQLAKGEVSNTDHRTTRDDGTGHDIM